MATETHSKDYAWLLTNFSVPSCKQFLFVCVVLERVLGDIKRLWTRAEFSPPFSSCEETRPYPRDAQSAEQPL